MFVRKHKWQIVFVCLVVFYGLNIYIKRAVYPYFFAQKYDETLEISKQDYFETTDKKPFMFKRGKYAYTLVPKIKYAVVAKVGFVDRYDTFFTHLYRGHSQKHYINLVPQDLLLVIGDMARDDIFSKFKFEHEERLGRVLCKGVKYRTSFMSGYLSEEEYVKNKKKYEECQPYIKAQEYNNYHPIPANANISRALSILKAGDVVYLEGMLVDVPDMGLKTGVKKNQYHENIIVQGMAPGMCFILYTTKVILNGWLYQ